MNEEIMIKAGFGDMVALVKESKCPFCREPVSLIGPSPAFRDDRSRREFEISGLCQACQDEIWDEENLGI